MLTNFSKWMIYTASYIVLYPILIIKILFKTREEDVTFIEKIQLEKNKGINLDCYFNPLKQN